MRQRYSVTTLTYSKLSQVDAAQLVSFHSTSKGLIGECGQRGGYMEFVGFSSATLAQFNKVAATSLSSNTIGQIFVGLMVCQKSPMSLKRALYCRERDLLTPNARAKVKGPRAGELNPKP